MDGIMTFPQVRITSQPKYCKAANGCEYCRFIINFQGMSITLTLFDDERQNSPYKQFKETLQRAKRLEEMTMKEALDEPNDFKTNAADALFIGETKVDISCTASVYDCGKYLKTGEEQLKIGYKVSDIGFTDSYGARQTLLIIRVKEHNTSNEKRLIDAPSGGNLSAFGI